MANWNENSQLSNVIKAVHEDFKANPPMPERRGQPGAQPMQALPGQPAHQAPGGNAVNFEEKTRYAGETVVLNKPSLQQLKDKI